DDQRPILIRCVSVSESERVYDYLCDHLPGKEIKLLNGRPVYANKEAEVIAESGTKGSIVVSTQIVGRGVDIKLQDKDKGLYALGFERQPFSRWDRQFSGRSGRQGDLGDSQFFCSYEHLFTSKGAGRVWPEHAPIDDERIRSEIEAYQRIRSKDSRTIRRQRIQRGQVIYNINSIFTDRIKVLASPDSSCLVCRDGNIDYGQFPGICVRCSHCLNKIKQTGQPCIQSFCIREGSLPNYYVYNSKNNACAWALIHEEFLDSKNPSLLSSIYVEAIEEVHYKLLSEVADWVNYIAAESLYPDHWATRFDRYYLNHMCRTIFGCQLDSGRLEQLEREYGLPGSEPIINPLSVYLKELMGKQIVTSQCPWRQLLKESHELVQESTESVDPPITDVKYRWYLDPNEMMLSPCQILQFLSRRLFGGSPVRMIRDVNGQMSYIADELNVEQCIAADKISRQIAIACLNNAWDQWYRRLDDIEDSRDQYHRNPLWDFDKQAQQYANRYLRIAQLRMVDCLIRVCRIADLKAGEDNLVAFSELLTPVCELLGWDPQDVACCIARKEDPLLGLLNLVIHLPDDSDLLKPIEFAEDLHEGGKML
ncbi:hypothetical protein KAR91_34985, partial [Candidatus Pacearchaeota archaeon]|nr:hypothetical protein [Candidatus Pacearchaeota archaeon]